MSIVTAQIWGGNAVDVHIYFNMYVDNITNPGFIRVSGLDRRILHTYIYSSYVFHLDYKNSVISNHNF